MGVDELTGFYENDLYGLSVIVERSARRAEKVNRWGIESARRFLLIIEVPLLSVKRGVAPVAGNQPHVGRVRQRQSVQPESPIKKQRRWFGRIRLQPDLLMMFGISETRIFDAKDACPHPEGVKPSSVAEAIITKALARFSKLR
jgi:hypothetical protein